MKDRISIEGRDGTFNAYIVRPKTLPASTVVVLQELFGVNADIRKTCDELAEQGFVAVAPDLFEIWIPKIESVQNREVKSSSTATHRTNVAVFENKASDLPCFPDCNIHHRPRQIVGANDLVGEQHPKRRVGRAQQTVAEIRLLARLDRIDICRPKHVNAREPCRDQRFLGLSLVAGEGHPALSRLVRAASA